MHLKLYFLIHIYIHLTLSYTFNAFGTQLPFDLNQDGSTILNLPNISKSAMSSNARDTNSVCSFRIWIDVKEYLGTLCFRGVFDTR